jgi:type II secretory pathway component PulF
MKRWAIYTVLVYALALIVLSMPVFAIAFGNWGKEQQSESGLGFHDILVFYSECFSQWFYWLWLGVLVIGQILLLMLPVNIAERRLPARRPLKIPVIVTGFFLANLFCAGIFCLACAALKDNALYVFSLVDLLCGHVSHAITAKSQKFKRAIGAAFPAP